MFELLRLVGLALALLGLAVIAQPKAEAHDRKPKSQALIEYRYCGTPKRGADGRIKRRSDVLRAFKARYNCPSTGEPTGSCPGWAIDHVIPLSVGGCDTVINLQWLPNEIKSSKGRLPKDRWEQEVYFVGDID